MGIFKLLGPNSYTGVVKLSPARLTLQKRSMPNFKLTSKENVEFYQWMHVLNELKTRITCPASKCSVVLALSGPRLSSELSWHGWRCELNPEVSSDCMTESAESRSDIGAGSVEHARKQFMWRGEVTG